MYHGKNLFQKATRSKGDKNEPHHLAEVDTTASCRLIG